MTKGVVMAFHPSREPVPVRRFGTLFGARFDAWTRNYDHRRAGSQWRFYACAAPTTAEQLQSKLSTG